MDWSNEMVHCGAVGWRVLSLDREDAIPSGSLPMHFVIPKSISEIDYVKLANCFRNGRAAIWVYSLENAALVRMAELMPTITDTRQENAILEIVRKCDPLMRQPHLMELSKLLPSNNDVQISYTKLRDLFTPDSTRQFMVRWVENGKNWFLLFILSFYFHFIATRCAILCAIGQNVLVAVCFPVPKIREFGGNEDARRTNSRTAGKWWSRHVLCDIESDTNHAGSEISNNERFRVAHSKGLGSAWSSV